jgi:phosphatidylinositol-3-phosphatase
MKMNFMYTSHKKSSLIFFFLLILTACSSLTPSQALPPTVSIPTSTKTLPISTGIPTQTVVPSATPQPTATLTPTPFQPNFTYIVYIVFENKEFTDIMGSMYMPVFNRLANTYTLLTAFYAETHPSMPNYLAMVGGSTFDRTTNCEDCFVNSPSLADQIEASGRTWKDYQEDMPNPCFIGSRDPYAQKHNPFIYFDPIRLDTPRCKEHIVPLTQLDRDIANGALPNFIFVTPNLCNDAHDCFVNVADAWLNTFLQKLTPVLDTTRQPYLIILTWDEGATKEGCCGLPSNAGGRIATVLISPQVKLGFKDDTPFTHYSLLKTIETFWGLPLLGHAADPETVLIEKPFQ